MTIDRAAETAISLRHWRNQFLSEKRAAKGQAKGAGDDREWIVTLALGLLIVGGLALLALGGELVVRGGLGAARAFKIPPVVIGVVLLGFGTSLPELVTSLESVFAGAPDIAIGNVVGSNIANLMLIAGLAAALTGAATTSRLIWRDGAVMLLATLAYTWILFNSLMTPLIGVALLAGLGLFFVLAMRGWTAGGAGDTETKPFDEEALGAVKSGAGVALLIFALGVAATVGGATLLVDGAVQLARNAEISEAVIGATIVAVGTSLPELAATVAAAVKGRSEMAIGNVFGSNIFNVCGIAGATALFGPFTTPASLVNLDIWVMIAATFLTLFLARSWAKLSRSEGVLLLLLYALYIGLTARNAAMV